MTDRVTDLDINAYIDGELDLQRRLAVEEHLAHDPAAAARVMADLSIRTALRLLHGESRHGGAEHAPASLVQDAERLETHLAARPSPRPRRMGWAAAALLVAGVGTASLTLNPKGAEASPPSYVADAAMAFRTGLLRVNMKSQREDEVFDRRDIAEWTRIRVPVLPDGWRVTDVQVVPSDEGPALQIMVRTDKGNVASVFAVRSAAAAPIRPVSVRHGDTSVAYWRNGDIAYALTGMEAPDALDLAAEDLADNRLE
ncbi:anti-sigma factor family protein [Sphingomonas crocodyli]|uniref:anti-sigma factor family protein n=1 Tax=Sphingomonas crocodyli TaxID=1979270 RepID=UPI0013E2E325|nr:zf-HC2 domain-containing protein [Sphingomonas crocodyli]